MMAASFDGRILRGGRSLTQPMSAEFPPKTNTTTAPPPTEYVPIFDVEDPFHSKPVVPLQPLQLSGDVSLVRCMRRERNTSMPRPEFDEWLPPEERLALRRFSTEKAGQVLDREAPEPSCAQWWEKDTGNDDDDDVNDDDNDKNQKGDVTSWVMRGKKMCKVEADHVTLSPRARMLDVAHDSGGGIQLSSSHRWLRTFSSVIIAMDAGKKGMRSVNILEYCLRKQEHALRCKSYAEAAKHWHDEYLLLSKRSEFQFWSDHLERRSIDACRHAKEVGLENALRGGGYDFGTGLDSGERALIDSNFSATKIHDLVWCGDVVKNLENETPVEWSEFCGGATATAAEQPTRVESRKIPSPSRLRRTATTKSVLQDDDDMKVLERQRLVVSSARSQYWNTHDSLRRYRSEERMVTTALYQVYAHTEFLHVLERRVMILTNYLCFVPPATLVPADTVGKGKKDEKQDNAAVRKIEALGGVSHLRGNDLMACRRMKSVPKWTIDLFLSLGIVAGTLSVDNALILSMSTKKKREIALDSLRALVGEEMADDTSKRSRCWRMLHAREARLEEKKRIEREEVHAVSNVRTLLESIEIKKFDRNVPPLVKKLMATYRARCNGQTSLRRWKVPSRRNAMDRIAEGVCLWLDEVLSYYRAAAPFWSTLNAQVPLQKKRQVLHEHVQEETRQLEILSGEVDEELEKLRQISLSLANQHETRHLREGQDLKWRRRLPGQQGSEEFYPELMVRDGIYRFPLPGEYGGIFRDDLRRHMNSWYVEDAAPWFAKKMRRHHLEGHKEHVHVSQDPNSYGDRSHPDHPERTFGHEKKAMEAEVERLKEEERKTQRRITKRMIEKATDTHLEEILGDPTTMLDHHVKHHSSRHHEEKMAGKTIWKWTWTHRSLPFSGHSRTDMLKSCSLPKMPFVPTAPN